MQIYEKGQKQLNSYSCTELSKTQLLPESIVKEFLPLRTEFTEVITSSGLDRKLVVLSLFTNNYSNCSQKYHEEPCKFQLGASGYFDGEYRKICP